MSQTRPESMPEQDVVDLLLRQHTEIRRLFEEVDGATGDERRDAFQRLVRMLAVHETAEEQVVHPTARRTMAAGDAVVDARPAEEHLAKDLLSKLESGGLDAADFDVRFAQLREAVLAHAEHEEQEEFPALRAWRGEEQRRAMALAVKAAEAVAPTHPHAGVETVPKHVAFGPMAAVIDRTRDVVREAMQRVRGSS
jgi:hemerythrin superfamily protein